MSRFICCHKLCLFLFSLSLYIYIFPSKFFTVKSLVIVMVSTNIVLWIGIGSGVPLFWNLDSPCCPFNNGAVSFVSELTLWSLHQKNMWNCLSLTKSCLWQFVMYNNIWTMYLSNILRSYFFYLIYVFWYCFIVNFSYFIFKNMRIFLSFNLFE